MWRTACGVSCCNSLNKKNKTKKSVAQASRIRSVCARRNLERHLAHVERGRCYLQNKVLALHKNELFSCRAAARAALPTTVALTFSDARKPGIESGEQRVLALACRLVSCYRTFEPATKLEAVPRQWLRRADMRLPRASCGRTRASSGRELQALYAPRVQPAPPRRAWRCVISTRFGSRFPALCRLTGEAQGKRSSRAYFK